MNANAENKQLAWEFIKFLSSMEANTDVFVPSLPVKKEVYDKILTESIGNYFDMMTEEGLSPAGDPEEAKAAAKAKLDSYAAMPMMAQTSPYFEILQENLQLFADGAITAEQLAADLQNKISIALME
jgi:ABC-type glycerol-3-phosphate transport system substrate-binding protein